MSDSNNMPAEGPDENPVGYGKYRCHQGGPLDGETHELHDVPEIVVDQQGRGWIPLDGGYAVPPWALGVYLHGAAEFGLDDVPLLDWIPAREFRDQ